jgi:hypothetical protein
LQKNTFAFRQIVIFLFFRQPLSCVAQLWPVIRNREVVREQLRRLVHASMALLTLRRAPVVVGPSLSFSVAPPLLCLAGDLTGLPPADQRSAADLRTVRYRRGPRYLRLPRVPSPSQRHRDYSFRAASYRSVSRAARNSRQSQRQPQDDNAEIIFSPATPSRGSALAGSKCRPHRSSAAARSIRWRRSGCRRPRRRALRHRGH